MRTGKRYLALAWAMDTSDGWQYEWGKTVHGINKMAAVQILRQKCLAFSDWFVTMTSPGNWARQHGPTPKMAITPANLPSWADWLYTYKTPSIQHPTLCKGIFSQGFMFPVTSWSSLEQRNLQKGFPYLFRKRLTTPSKSEEERLVHDIHWL